MTDPTPYQYVYIRRVLGATGTMAGVLADIDIDEAWEIHGPRWRLAAAYLADSLAARAINDPASFTAVGDMSVSWNNRAEMWLRVGKSLRAEEAQAIDDEQEVGGMVSAALYRSASQVETDYVRRRPKRRNW